MKDVAKERDFSTLSCFCGRGVVGVHRVREWSNLIKRVSFYYAQNNNLEEERATYRQKTCEY